MSDQKPPQIILDPTLTQPLRPVPLASANSVSTPASKSDQRRAEVQAELEQLQQEESSLLNNIKDWLSKVQGSETKQQALERELFELDRTSQGGNTAQAQAAAKQKQLEAFQVQQKAAQVKVQEIVKLQKIDEKKAFDNYSAGGLDRQGLLQEMDLISKRYAEQLAAAQQSVMDIQSAITALTTIPTAVPEAVEIPATEVTASPTPTLTVPEPSPTTPTPSIETAAAGSLLDKLTKLPGADAGLLGQLVHTLPNQGTLPLIERSRDSTGIIVSANNQAEMEQRLYISDADLLRVVVTAEDIIPLPVSQWSAQEATPFIPTMTVPQ